MNVLVIVVFLLLAAGVVYQECRLRKVLRALRSAGSVSKCQCTLAHQAPADNAPEHSLPPSAGASRARHLVELLFPVHSWHGVSPGDKAPETVNAFIEIVPTDTVKYELDKHSGHLCIDRPQRFSANCPTLYGFIPRSYCAEEVGKFCADRTGKTGICGDGDPIDICVLTEKTIPHGNILVRARPIGGLRMIDGNRADDKIIAVLENDLVYGGIKDVSELEPGVVDRLRHYFLTYKLVPGMERQPVEIIHVYGREEAQAVIAASLKDYRAHYGAPETRFEELRRLLSEPAESDCAKQ